MTEFDVIIIGGGPSGSVAASYLAMNKVNVAVMERENFPRFHIGESLLPASMPIYKEIGFYDKLAASQKYIQKYGARFIDYSNDDEIYFGFDGGFNPDIPMAFEVERSEFDKDLLDHAKSCGATVLQPERVKEITEHADFLSVITNKGEYRAKYIIDSTGRDAFLGKRKNLRSADKDLNNFAVFAHFNGVTRYEGKNEGDITIGLLPNRSWTWIIPFKGEKTSVGIVASSMNVPQGMDLNEYLDTELRKSPRVMEMMKHAERTMEVTTIANYSQTNAEYYGDRWIMSGDASTFLDPIFSSGVYVASQSGLFAAQTTLKALGDKLKFTECDLGKDYEQLVRKGIQRFKNLIMLFYTGNFVKQMKQTLERKNMREGFTSAVAGDVWNDKNFLFEKGVL
ncbi:MAG: tryptophan 7-halogenase [Bdellovibrionaceae bacterium]|nr:tryptophan 7-halogenase [Pseudobdellovibrionaceae bacterium]